MEDTALEHKALFALREGGRIKNTWCSRMPPSSCRQNSQQTPQMRSSLSLILMQSKQAI